MWTTISTISNAVLIDRNFWRIRNPRQVYIYSILLGITAGLGAILFTSAYAWAEFATFHLLVGMPLSHAAGEIQIHSSLPPANFRPIVLFFLPIVGGLLTGTIIYLFCREAEGTGTDAVIHAFHHNEGKMGARVPIFKALTTIITLASGGSAGKEGPATQIGAGIGSAFAGYIGSGARARRTFLLAGSAAGIAAIFSAPLGAALIAVEGVYREDMESDSLIPAIIASVSAYLTYSFFVGSRTIFEVSDVALGDYREILFYVLLGLTATGFGYLFTRIFHRSRELFKAIPVHPIFRPAIGGAIVGAVALFYPEVIGAGFGFLQDLFRGETTMQQQGDLLQLSAFFLLLAILKIITTTSTIASGGSGGVMGPSLFIGGMLGGCVGSFASWLFPELNISISAFILVGMGSFFSGVASAPIAGMVMVCDMVGDYKLLPPLMIVSIISVVLSHRWSIYKGQLANRFSSPAHYWDMNLDKLDSMTIDKSIGNYRRFAMVENRLLLAELEELAPKVQASDFVITDSAGRYRGMFSLRRLRLDQELSAIRNLITLDDVAESKIPSVSPDSSLGEALRILSEWEMDKVAVTENDQLLGYIRYIDIMRAYRVREYGRFG